MDKNKILAHFQNEIMNLTIDSNMDAKLDAILNSVWNNAERVTTEVVLNRVSMALDSTVRELRRECQ